MRRRTLGLRTPPPPHREDQGCWEGLECKVHGWRVGVAAARQRQSCQSQKATRAIAGSPVLPWSSMEEKNVMRSRSSLWQQCGQGTE